MTLTAFALQLPFLQRLPATSMPPQTQNQELSPQELEVLQQLADIHTPAAIAMWPPTFISMLVFALLFIILFTVSISAFRKYRDAAYRREALKHLQALEAQAQDLNASELISQVCAVQKRVDLSAYPHSRADIASQYGKAWYERLNAQLKPKQKIDSKLLQSWENLQFCHSDPNKAALDTLIVFTKNWIKQHPVTQQTKMNGVLTVLKSLLSKFRRPKTKPAQKLAEECL